MSNFDYYEDFEALLNEYMPVKEDEEIKSKVTGTDRKSTRLNSSHSRASRMPSSA